MKELMDSWTQFKADGFVFMMLNIFVIFMAMCGGIGIVCRIVRKRRESAGKTVGFGKTKRVRGWKEDHSNYDDDFFQILQEEQIRRQQQGFNQQQLLDQQLIDQQQLLDQQQAMADATGIEFGGNNCDPNLNPGLFHEQGGFNDGGGNDMFWEPFSF